MKDKKSLSKAQRQALVESACFLIKAIGGAIIIIVSAVALKCFS